MILAGDIGGTSTRLALFNVAGGQLSLVAQNKFVSREHKGLDEIVVAFVAQQKSATGSDKIEHAAFGIAGPIRDGKVHTPNLPWIVDAAQLAAELNVKQVHLLNDLEANAHGIAALSASDFVTLNAGSADRRGNAAIISAGTGLGEAGIYFDGKQLHPFACEGGHSDFAPRNPLETELLLHLSEKFAQAPVSQTLPLGEGRGEGAGESDSGARHPHPALSQGERVLKPVQGSAGHVSFERVLSGPGLKNIYEFLRDTGRGQETPAVKAAMLAGDASAAISIAALNNSCPLCVDAMNMFVGFYGAEAGNLALKIMATRGIYIGGGIAPKIIAKLQEPTFLSAFQDKGRLKPLLQAIPVRVIMNDHAALLGSARFAAVQAGLLPDWLG